MKRFRLGPAAGFAGLLFSWVLLACGPNPSGSASAQEAQPGPAPAAPNSTTVPVAARQEPLLPRFEGDLLGGGRASTDLLKGKRGVVFFFASSDSAAKEIGDIVQRLQAESAGENIAFLGVNRDAKASDAKTYAERYKLAFPILSDGNLTISSKLGARAGTPVVALVDNQGYVLDVVGLERAEDASYLETRIRETLRLPDAEADSLAFGVQRTAPAFVVSGLDGKKLDSASLKGKVTMVIFFLHTCPHCHEALQFLQRFQEKIGRDDLAIVPISVRPANKAVEDMAQQLGVKLALYVDPERNAQDKYPSTGSVPSMYVIDRAGKIIAHHEGMDGRIEALLTMEIRQALGVENPILLTKEGYSGEETCRICHSGPHATWSLTNHAFAFDTLVTRGEQLNAECVACHSVGFDQPGGYNLTQRPRHLEGVQCENCHGRGGPHQSPDFAKQGYEKVCTTCHNATHSLRFDLAERLPLISHAANQQFAGLSVQDRKALLERRGRRERALFDAGEYAGSASCQSCHKSEHENWSKSPHAKAFSTLAAKKETANAECQNCHTTGFNKPGGFPAGGAALEAVGCESCHGPGKEHAKPDTPKRGNILALADKCDSCVILQICGSCHDEKNDPGFEFAVERKIDLIRHHPKPAKGTSAE